MKTDWICTDLDNKQYGRQLSETRFEFKEKNRGLLEYDEDEFIEFGVNLSDYSEKEIGEVARNYYSSLDELKEKYGKNWQWILAECIFEQENGLY
jgi:hypothetical protein